MYSKSMELRILILVYTCIDLAYFMLKAFVFGYVSVVRVLGFYYVCMFGYVSVVRVAVFYGLAGGIVQLKQKDFKKKGSLTALLF